MGAAIGTDDKKSVNIDLNIVPLIDLMSCLTAFLLFTAVWVHNAQLDIKPKGKTRDRPTEIIDPIEQIDLSVLLTADQIWVGLSRVNEFQTVAKTPAGHDWAKLGELLATHKKSAFFADREDLEIAAESTPQSVVNYQDLITAMDTAQKAGFKDVGLTDPPGLAARPQL